MFKIYIGNLDKRTTAEHVRRLFVTFPDLNDLVLAEDPKTGQSRCFAIAMFKDSERGKAAIAALAGRRLHGRPLTVAEALTKKAKKEAGLDVPGGATGPRRPGRPGMGGDRFSRRPDGGPKGAGGPGFGGARGPGSSDDPRGGPGAGREEVRRPGQRPWHRAGGAGRPFGGGSSFGAGPGGGPSGGQGGGPGGRPGPRP